MSNNCVNWPLNMNFPSQIMGLFSLEDELSSASEVVLDVVVVDEPEIELFYFPAQPAHLCVWHNDAICQDGMLGTCPECPIALHVWNISNHSSLRTPAEETGTETTYFFPPTLRMTGPETILSAMMRKGEGGRGGRAPSVFSSLTTAWKVEEGLMLGRTFLFEYHCHY